MTRNQLRAHIRRLAWRDILRAADRPQPAPEEASDDALLELYASTRADIFAYLEAREAGYLISPPGGVVGADSERWRQHRSAATS